MTVAQFFGCGLLAFGPPVVIFIITIAKDPIRVIMMVASSFFWLLALLFSSIMYKIVVPLQPYLAFGALFSVLFQELFRFLWFVVIQKAEVGLKKVSEDNLEITENKHILAYVSGLGFGMICGAFSLVNVLADMTGPGTVGIHGDPPLFFVATTMTSLAFILLHVCWGVIFFNALHHRLPLQLAYVIASHLLATSLTLLNPMYWVSVPLVWMVAAISSWLALYVTGVTPASIKLCLKLPVRARTLEVTADATASADNRTHL